MHVTLYRAQRILLGLLLGGAGLYAGILLMYSVGFAPVLDAEPSADFLRLWQLHDFYFHLRIRFVLAGLGVLYLLTLLAHLTAIRTKTFAFLLLGLLLSATEVEVNRAVQRPVNRSLRLADEGVHSSSSVYSMERQLFHALHLRQLFAISAFGMLCIGAMLPHRRPRDPSRSAAAS